MLEIKVLGPGCPKCKALEKATRQAVTELDLDAKVEKEEDIMKIMGYGIMFTPGLVINGKVVHSGSALSVGKIKELINQNQ